MEFADVLSLYCYLPPEAMLMPVACTVTEGLVGLYVPALPVVCVISLYNVTVESVVDILCLSCCMKPCLCPWALLPQEAILIHMVCVTT